MRNIWQKQPERGSSSLMRFMAWLSLNTDRRFARLLLYPICTYFFLSSSTARAASRKYLSIISGQPATLTRIFRHYLTFARVLLDRVFLLAGRLDPFDVSIEGLDIVDAQMAKGRGCLFLGAHMGSFEVLRALGVLQRQLPIKILMYPDNSRRTFAIMEALNPAMARAIIPLGRPNTMIQAKFHLDEGGVIGLLGDRLTSGDKTLRANFLGQPADFPTGPIMLASTLKVPVILFSGLYLGGARYDIHFELFSDEISISRENRERDLQVWIDHYAARLGETCRRAPYNWFNFYDFWDSSDGSA